MEYYDNLIEAIIALKKKGSTVDFNLTKNCLQCGGGEYDLFHDEFEADKYFHFEGDFNPDDTSIIYAISSKKYNLKGILINAYRIYSEVVVEDMIDKLKT